MNENDSVPKPRARLRVKLAAPSPTESARADGGGAEGASKELATARPAFAGETYCRNHPHDLARFLCRKCKRYFCELCVASRPVEGVTEHFCRRCGQLCQPVITAVAERVQEPFIKLACRAFRYPFEGSGAYLVVTGTLFLALLDVVLWVVSHAMLIGLAASIILTVLGGGYLFSFVKSVVLSSAQGSDELPDWPDISDIAGEVVAPFFQSVMLVAFCLGPGLVLMGYSAVTENPPVALGGGALIFLGLCYLPMALLGVAMFDGVSGLNPVLGIPSVAQTVGHYLFTLVVFFSIIGLGVGMEFLFTQVLAIPILPTVLSAFFDFYAMMVLARTLGLLYRVNEAALGWFKPRNR